MRSAVSAARAGQPRGSRRRVAVCPVIAQGRKSTNAGPSGEGGGCPHLGRLGKLTYEHSAGGGHPGSVHHDYSPPQPTRVVLVTSNWTPHASRRCPQQGTAGGGAERLRRAGPRVPSARAPLTLTLTLTRAAARPRPARTPPGPPARLALRPAAGHADAKPERPPGPASSVTASAGPLLPEAAGPSSRRPNRRVASRSTVSQNPPSGGPAQAQAASPRVHRHPTLPATLAGLTRTRRQKGRFHKYYQVPNGLDPSGAPGLHLKPRFSPAARGLPAPARPRPPRPPPRPGSGLLSRRARQAPAPRPSAPPSSARPRWPGSCPCWLRMKVT